MKPSALRLCTYETLRRHAGGKMQIGKADYAAAALEVVERLDAELGQVLVAAARAAGGAEAPIDDVLQLVDEVLATRA